MAATFDAVTAGTNRMGGPARTGLSDLDARMNHVYGRHYERLVGFFLRRTQDELLAEDLAHDTMVRFVAAADRFDWERPVWPFLKTTAVNLLIDHQRRHDREMIIDIANDPDWLEVPEEGQEVDDAVVLGELLEEAIARLPDRQRAAVELRCRRGWSVPDAAEFLGLPRAAFNQLLYRARESLRERLESLGARGFVLPTLVGLRVRLRTAFDRIRDVVPTPSAGLGAEGLASMVIVTTISVAVAAGGGMSTDSSKTASSLSASSTNLIVHEARSTASPGSPGGGAPVRPAPPVAPSTEDVPATAAEQSPDASRTTVIETPDAVPDSDGRVDMGDDDERFDVAYEVEATTDVAAVAGENDLIYTECDEFTESVLCSSKG